MENVLIDDDVQTLGKSCPKCDNYNGDWWHTTKIIPYKDQGKKQVYTWHCHNCDTEFASVQDYDVKK